MSRPLYRDHALANKLEPSVGGNAGLFYEKFFDGWNDEWKLSAPSPRQPGGKVAFLERFAANLGTERSWGDATLARDSARRRRELVEARGGTTISMRTTTRLVAGLTNASPTETSLTWHRTFGVPYVPGSSVKGVALSWARHDEGIASQIRDRIFGTSTTVGSVIFFDLLPTTGVRLEADVLTPHYADSAGDVGDWHDPVPITFLTVARDQAFDLALAPRRPSEHAAEDLKTATRWVIEATRDFGLGAKSSSGYGRLEKVADPSAAQPAIRRELRYASGSEVTLIRIADEKNRGRFFARADDGHDGSFPNGAPPVEIGETFNAFVKSANQGPPRSYTFSLEPQRPSNPRQQGRPR